MSTVKAVCVMRGDAGVSGVVTFEQSSRLVAIRPSKGS